MEKQDRELLLKVCDLFQELAQIHLETYRAMRALALAARTQIPGLEATYRKALEDAEFATETSAKANVMILQIQEIISHLKLADS